MFASFTRAQLERGVFKSHVDLRAAINRYLAEYNKAPKPFTWIENPDTIIAEWPVCNDVDPPDRPH